MLVMGSPGEWRQPAALRSRNETTDSHDCGVAQAELDDIRALIEQRSAILFEPSRERFFSARVREILEEKGWRTGADLLRRIPIFRRRI